MGGKDPFLAMSSVSSPSRVRSSTSIAKNATVKKVIIPKKPTLAVKKATPSAKTVQKKVVTKPKSNISAGNSKAKSAGVSVSWPSLPFTNQSNNQKGKVTKPSSPASSAKTTEKEREKQEQKRKREREIVESKRRKEAEALKKKKAQQQKVAKK